MEYFPASNDEQMEVIKRYIDECDYYILVIGDEYGSVNSKTNKSYIQMEYEYAEQKGIPICVFIKKDQKNCKKKDLAEFCDKIKQKKMCGFWKDENELAFEILKSLSDLKNRNPQGGWVKYDKITLERDSECLKLKKENEKLLEQICFLSSQKPQGTECFQQGNDEFTIRHEFIYPDDRENPNSNKVFSVTKTWNQIFLAVCNLLLQPVTEAAIKEQLAKSFEHEYYTIIEEDFQTILVQLMALKLINVDSIEKMVYASIGC